MKTTIKYNNTEFRHTGIRFYYISDNGVVLSNYRNQIKIMKPHIDHDRYYKIELKIKPNVPKTFSISRLVYKVYGKEPLVDGLVIDHIDADTSNNSINNLRQITQKENILHALNNGRFGQNNNKKCILYDKKENKEVVFPSIKSIADFLDIKVSNGAISSLKKRRVFKERFEIIKV